MPPPHSPSDDLSENRFYLQIIRTISLLIGLTVLTIGGCEMYQTHQIAAAIEKGADPIKARCALAGADSEGKRAVCLAVTR